MSIDVEALAEAIGPFVTDLTGHPFRTDADEVRRFLLPRLVPAEDGPQLVNVPDFGDSPSYFVKATVPAEDGPTEPCPTCMQPVYVPQRGDHDYGIPLVPAEDEGRLREAAQAVVASWDDRWIGCAEMKPAVESLRAALATTPEPR